MLSVNGRRPFSELRGRAQAPDQPPRVDGAAGQQLRAPKYPRALMLAVFGIDNDGVNLAVNLLILFLVVVWLALVYWTYADARRRVGDPMLVACATGASLFPFVGTIVYLIVRPPEFLEDARERELEMQAAEARLVHYGFAPCGRCAHAVRIDGGSTGRNGPALPACELCGLEVLGAVEPPLPEAPRRRRRRREVEADPDETAAFEIHQDR